MDECAAMSPDALDDDGEPEAIPKKVQWGDRRKRTAARNSIPVTRNGRMMAGGLVAAEDGQIPVFGCSLCTTFGDAVDVRAVEVFAVYWPMCRGCEQRLRRHPLAMIPEVLAACARVAFSARTHGVVLQWPKQRDEEEE